MSTALLLITVPVLCALLGALFNRLAAGYFFGTILPGKKAVLARSLGDYVSREFPVKAFSDKLLDPAALEALKPTIAAHVDSFLKVRLKEKIPVLSMFVGDSMLETIKEGLLEEIDTLLPQILSQYTSRIGEKLDLGKMVEQKLLLLPEEKLSGGLRNGLKREIRAFSLFGAATGFVIGGIAVLLSLLR